MQSVRACWSHDVRSRHSGDVTCGRSARVRNAEPLGVTRYISGHSDWVGGLVAWGTVSGAILGRGEVPGYIHRTSTVCVHHVRPTGRLQEIDMPITRDDSPPKGLFKCSDVS